MLSTFLHLFLWYLLISDNLRETFVWIIDFISNEENTIIPEEDNVIPDKEDIVVENKEEDKNNININKNIN